MRHRTLVATMATVTLAAAALAATPLAGQESHAVDRTELERATARADRAEDARREAIRSVLVDERVEAVAEGHGIDLVEARAAVGTLEGDALARAAAQAERLEAALAGGDDMVVISTTTLILALLVLIIILVA